MSVCHCNVCCIECTLLIVILFNEAVLPAKLALTNNQLIAIYRVFVSKKLMCIEDHVVLIDLC